MGLVTWRRRQGACGMRGGGGVGVGGRGVFVGWWFCPAGGSSLRVVGWRCSYGDGEQGGFGFVVPHALLSSDFGGVDDGADVRE